MTRSGSTQAKVVEGLGGEPTSDAEKRSTAALRLQIEPEPTEEESAAITAAVTALLEQSLTTPRVASASPSTTAAMRGAAWKAARRPRPTPHLIKGVEPGTAWRLSGLLGKPFGR